jgi:2,6-dihydroxypyridine 3-monooxygenase
MIRRGHMTDNIQRVFIVGGSIGGLSAGLLLRDLGRDVTIFERSRTRLVSQGAGIVIHPTTVRYLIERAGRTLEDVSTAATWERYLDEDGEVAHEDACRFRFTSYSRLYNEMLRVFDGARYAMASEAVGLDPAGPGAEITLADGRRESCDLLVCADGVHSIGRRTLLPEVAPQYAGYVGWRGTVEPSKLSARTNHRLRDALTYHVMPNSHILVYPIPRVGSSGDEVTNWVWYRNVSEGAELADLMTDRNGRAQTLSVSTGLVQQRHVDALMEAAAGLPAPLAEMVKATRNPFIQAIYDVEVPRMAFGRTCLVGDAAFVVRPHAAAGSAKAADDAWTLAEAVAAADDPGTLETALSAWEASRIALGRQLLERARETGTRLQFSGVWRPGAPIPFGLYAEGDSTTVPVTR